MEEKSELSKLIEKMALTKEPYLDSRIGQIIKQYSITNKWVPTITDENGMQLTHRVGNKEYIPIFSDYEFIVAKGNAVTATSFNKIIKPIFENSRFGGIEINPFVHGVGIESIDLMKMIIGKREPFEDKNKDWGKGIPSYSECDILDDKRILDFAMQIIGISCEKIGIEPIFYSNDLDACPNLLIKKDGKPAFVLVNADIAPNQPKINYEDREMLIKRSKDFGFDCYYASVGLGSTDSERFEKSLALRGDSYYANFKGLEKIDDTYN